jgi:hypothetical protein
VPFIALEEPLYNTDINFNTALFWLPRSSIFFDLVKSPTK